MCYIIKCKLICKFEEEESTFIDFLQRVGTECKPYKNIYKEESLGEVA